MAAGAFVVLITLLIKDDMAGPFLFRPLGEDSPVHSHRRSLASPRTGRTSPGRQSLQTRSAPSPAGSHCILGVVVSARRPDHVEAAAAARRMCAPARLQRTSLWRGDGSRTLSL